HLLAGGVRVRLKSADFQSFSRQCTLAAPTDVAEALYRAGLGLLPRFDHPGPFRLVGLTAHDLRPGAEHAQLDLLGSDRDRRLEVTLDELSARFGDNVVRRARDLGSATVMRDAPDRDGPHEDLDEEPDHA
ncbi:MAG TPA: hypothetical protein VIS76_10275, partial [Pseudomonadales bacterium]